MGRRHDYRCLACGVSLLDVYVPSALSAQAGAPLCPECEHPQPMEWMPAIGIMGVFGDNQKFTTTIEDPGVAGGQRVVEIDSLQTIRRLERESEQRARNNEGRAMCWRDFSQGKSNTDVHTLGTDPSLRPAKTLSNGLPVVRRVGAAVTADHGTAD